MPDCTSIHRTERSFNAPLFPVALFLATRCIVKYNRLLYSKRSHFFTQVIHCQVLPRFNDHVSAMLSKISYLFNVIEVVSYRLYCIV